MQKESCEEFTEQKFQNINGEPVMLKTYQNNGVLKFVVQRQTSKNNLVFLLVVVVMNLIFLSLPVIDVRYCVLIFIGCIVYMLVIATGVEEEALTVVKTLGYQLDSKYFIGSKFQFIPWDEVRDVFINEVISKHRVLFMLSLITKKDTMEKPNLVTLFTETKPELKCLVDMYRSLKQRKYE